MVVVIGIIALMFLFGASTLLRSRDDFILDDKVEEVLTVLREAQNKSVAISRDSASNDTKVWSVRFNRTPAGYVLVSYYPDADPTRTAAYEERRVDFPAGFSTNLSTTWAFVHYSAPFGKTYLTQASMGYGGESAGNFCHFKTTSDRPLKDYFISHDSGGSCSPYYISTENRAGENFSITLSYRGKTRTITVNPNGDAYAN